MLPSGKSTLSEYPKCFVPSTTGAGFTNLPNASATSKSAGSPLTMYPAQGRLVFVIVLSIFREIGAGSAICASAAPVKLGSWFVHNIQHPLHSELVGETSE